VTPFRPGATVARSQGLSRSIVGKLSLAGVSLVAAVPAGLLAFVLLKSGFLDNFETVSKSTMLMVVVGLTLLASLLPLALPPVLLAQHFLSRSPAEPKSKKKGDSDEGADDLDAIAEGDDLVEAEPSAEDVEAGDIESVADDDLMSEELVEANAGDELTEELDDMDLGGGVDLASADDDFDSTETAEWEAMDDDKKKG